MGTRFLLLASDIQCVHQTRIFCNWIEYCALLYVSHSQFEMFCSDNKLGPSGGTAVAGTFVALTALTAVDLRYRYEGVISIV